MSSDELVASNPMGPDQRHHERIPLVRPGRLTETATRACHEVTTNDVSCGGCCVYSPVGFDVGKLVEVAIELEPGVSAKLRGIVRHHTADLDGNRLGIEFDRPLARDYGPELRALIDETLERRARLLL